MLEWESIYYGIQKSFASFWRLRMCSFPWAVDHTIKNRIRDWLYAAFPFLKTLPKSGYIKIRMSRKNYKHRDISQKARDILRKSHSMNQRVSKNKKNHWRQRSCETVKVVMKTGFDGDSDEGENEVRYFLQIYYSSLSFHNNLWFKI